MAYAKTSLRREKRELRERMRSMGMDYRQIAAEFARVYQLRPRAAWREAYGWSLQETADKVNRYRGDIGLDPGGVCGMTAAHLCEHENWPGYGDAPAGRKPSPGLLAVLAGIFDCQVPDLIDLADRKNFPPADRLIIDTYIRPPARAGADGTSYASAGPQPLQHPAQSGVPAATGSDITRTRPGTGRQLGTDGEVTQAVLQGPVAPELAGYFASQLAGHYSADRFLGPMRLIPTALSQYELLCEVASAAGGSLRGDLWSVAAGYAALLGWLYQDGGDLGASAGWHDVMIERAHRSQDVQLVVFGLYCKAMLHADMKDGAGVLDLAGAGLSQAKRLCPKVRVLLLQQAAHGMALALGDSAADECGRLLDQAAGLVDAIDDDYPWGGNSRTPGYIDVQRATICTRLGRAQEGLQFWERVIPEIPASSRRDLGVYRARQAQALAASGEPERAVAIASQIAPLVAETGSARMRAELAAMRRPMKPWKSQPPGQALEEVLADIGIA